MRARSSHAVSLPRERLHFRLSESRWVKAEVLERRLLHTRFVSRPLERNDTQVRRVLRSQVTRMLLEEAAKAAAAW